jgi:hypothetical protein
MPRDKNKESTWPTGPCRTNTWPTGQQLGHVEPIHGLLGSNWAMPNQYMAYWAAIGPCRTNT